MKTPPVLSNWRQKWRNLRTDGCSSAPDLWLTPCCNDHDRAYATGRDIGGKPITRAQADAIFYRCCRARSWNRPIFGRIVPALYWLAVRLFGAGHWKQERRGTKKT